MAMHQLGRTLANFCVDHHWRTSTLGSCEEHQCAIFLFLLKYNILSLYMLEFALIIFGKVILEFWIQLNSFI